MVHNGAHRGLRCTPYLHHTEDGVHVRCNGVRELRAPYVPSSSSLERVRYMSLKNTVPKKNSNRFKSKPFPPKEYYSQQHTYGYRSCRRQGCLYRSNFHCLTLRRPAHTGCEVLFSSEGWQHERPLIRVCR